MASDCIFCGILAGDIPSTRIEEDERTIAFMDINPGTEGHALVIPRTHSKDLLEIDPEDLAACAQTAQRVAARAVANLGATGVNLLNCCGSDAWQTVFHFHFHVIPRYGADDDRDGLRLPWVPRPGDLDAIAATAERLRG